jgi:predicted DNA repair protein MutK
LDLVAAVPHTIHDLAVSAGEAVPAAQAVVEWVVGALGSALVGIVVGGVIVAAFHLWPRKKAKAQLNA